MRGCSQNGLPPPESKAGEAEVDGNGVRHLWRAEFVDKPWRSTKATG
jgi:hypothetical protein